MFTSDRAIDQRALEAGMSDGKYFAKVKEIFREMQLRKKEKTSVNTPNLLFCGFLLTLGVRETEELQSVWQDIDAFLINGLKEEQIIKDLNRMYIEYALVQRSS